jgi:Delta7-sterol 5-desaturase
MDIVLEIFDSFVFDPIYATLLPAGSTSPVSKYVQSIATSTFSSMRESSTGFLLKQREWTYEPSTQFFSIQPSHWAYESSLSRDNGWRQLMTLFAITLVFGNILYFVCSGLSYWLVFDKSTFKHPKFLKDQVKLEIKQAMSGMVGMAALTAPCFWLDVRGYAKLYDHPDEAPFWLYNFLQFPFFLLFTDMLIYFIHRGLHHPSIYKTLHKAHHKWIMPTPFASHAFHPVDGFLQSVPYHLFPFLFPLQKFAYVTLFVFVNIWTIFIHDGEYMANSPILNGAACHTMHHLYFNYSMSPTSIKVELY